MTPDTTLSKTPILDLEAPVPERRTSKGLSEGMILFIIAASAIGFVSLLGWASRTHNTYVMAALNWPRDIFGAYYVVAGPLWAVVLVGIVYLLLLGTVAIHEAGHALAGQLVGFHIKEVRVGPVAISSIEGGSKFRLSRRETLDCLTLMEIRDLRKLRKRLAMFISGGPLASFASCVFAESFLLTRIGDSLPRGLRGLGHLFVAESLVILVFALAPRLGRNGWFSDGARLDHLLNSLPMARRWLSLQALWLQNRTGVSVRDWKGTWIQAATSIPDDSHDALSGFFMAYSHSFAREEPDSAAIYLERALERSYLLNKQGTQALCLEAAVFQAWLRNDAEKAAKWLNRVKSPEALPPILKTRSAIAMCCAEKKYEESRTLIEKAFEEIKKMPVTPVTQRLDKDWQEWRHDIEAREAKHKLESLPAP